MEKHEFNPDKPQENHHIPEQYINPISMPFNLQHLPIANISRIMKGSLNPKAKVSKVAKETVQECVSEFISFITGEAVQRSRMEKRKTISGDDILTSMEVLGFDRYAEILREYLSRYRKAWEMLDREVNDLIVEDSGSRLPDISSICGSEIGKGQDDMSIM